MIKIDPALGFIAKWSSAKNID